MRSSVLIKTTKLTDTFGNILIVDDNWDEPLPGSILVTDGWWGTAWQRRFDDGLWHSTRGGTPRTFERLLRRRNCILIYDAGVRE